MQCKSKDDFFRVFILRDCEDGALDPPHPLSLPARQLTINQEEGGIIWDMRPVGGITPWGGGGGLPVSKIYREVKRTKEQLSRDF